MTTRYGVKDETPTPTNLISMFGAHIFGLDAATPTGTNATEDVVADFTGGTFLVAGDASNTIPVVNNTAQTTGTNLKINVKGRYLVTGMIPIIGAVTVQTALSIDSPAGELSTDPATLTPNIFARTSAVGVAALTMPCVVSGEVKISQVMAATATLGLVRLLLSNGAGTGPAAAALLLAAVYLKIERVGDYEGP